jgi:hypothetical protein
MYLRHSLFWDVTRIRLVVCRRFGTTNRPSIVEDGEDRLSRNAGKRLLTFAANTSQKSECLNHHVIKFKKQVVILFVK